MTEHVAGSQGEMCVCMPVSWIVACFLYVCMAVRQYAGLMCGPLYGVKRQQLAKFWGLHCGV